MSAEFVRRYGPWCVVAGASEGLGAAFADGLARRGVHVVLLARRAELLDDVASRIRKERGVEVRTLALDLADPSFAERLAAGPEGLDVGLGVYNAAYSYIAPLLERPLDDTLRVIDVNVRGPVRFVHALAPSMVARGRGGVVLMSSMAGFQGSPRLAAYAASKAFNIVLGESLWAELRPKGVDVLVSCAGAIRTPNYLATTRKEAPGTLDAAEVVEQTLGALGSRSMIVPGGVNKLARFFLGRLVSREGAVGIMAASTKGLQ